MKNKFNITLINPPVNIYDVYGKYSNLAAFQPPIGLCSLAAHLIKGKFSEVKIIDACVLLMSIPDVVNEIVSNSPNLVGIYCNTSSYHVVQELVKGIKSVSPLLKIVLGGPHPSVLSEETLEGIDADFAVIGEGEETLLELVKYLNDGAKDFSRIKGLVYRTEGDVILTNEPRPRIEDLDSLAFPAISLLPDIKKYKLYMMQYRRLPYMPILSSRGCPFDCIFCNTPFGKKVSFHSAAYISDYIEYLNKKVGVKEVVFNDDTFTVKEDRVIDLCKLINKKNIDVSWYANVRVDIKNKEIFKLMKSAGCWICAIGAESGNQNIINLLGKRFTIEQIKETAKHIKDAGLILKVFFMLGNIKETVSTIDETINFAKSLKCHFPVFSLLTPYPGTKLWHCAKEYGEFEYSDYRQLIISNSDPLFVPNGLSKEILLSKQKEAFHKCYFNVAMLVRHLRTVRSLSGIWKLVKAGVVFTKI